MVQEESRILHLYLQAEIQRFSPLSSRWEHGSIQAGMVQADLRVLHLHPKAASGRLALR